MVNDVATAEENMECFETRRGVRQDCPLRHSLLIEYRTMFNIFMDDIDDECERKNKGGTVKSNEKVSAPKFAEDISVLSKSWQTK